MFTLLKTWGPVVASFSAVIIATGFVFSKASAAREVISTAIAVGSSLSTVATQVTQGVLSPDEADSLKLNRKELEARLEDASRPSLLVSQISECARESGAVVREIKPILATRAKGAEQEAFPRYRVALDCSYRELADFMDACATVRLPSRVIQCQIVRSGDPEIGTASLLKAEITLEAFDPAVEARQAKGGTE